MPKKSTTKTSTIRTISGERLRLTPTRLIQIDHPGTGNPWYATKEDLRIAYRRDEGIRIFEVGRGCRIGCRIWVTFSPAEYNIGCCDFSEETFRQIVRYYGLRKSRSKARA